MQLIYYQSLKPIRLQREETVIEDDTSAVNQKKAQSDETFSLIMHRLKKISTYIYINLKKKKVGGRG